MTVKYKQGETLTSWFLHVLSQINKGMVPLGSVCSEDVDVDENYVPMSAATTEPPAAPRLVRTYQCVLKKNTTPTVQLVFVELLVHC